MKYWYMLYHAWTLKNYATWDKPVTIDLVLSHLNEMSQNRLTYRDRVNQYFLGLGVRVRGGNESDYKWVWVSFCGDENVLKVFGDGSTMLWIYWQPFSCTLKMSFMWITS